MYACSIPHNSSMILIIGAALFVVQLAFETISSVPSKICSFTPRTTVFIVSTSEGAERITFFAPASRCAFNSSCVLYLPVDSITISIECDFQSMFAIFFS
ncbi:hypothetical protein D3C72_511690 [compost metagenome]